MNEIGTRIYQFFRRLFLDREFRTGTCWWLALSLCLFVLSAVLAAEAEKDNERQQTATNVVGTATNNVASPNAGNAGGTSEDNLLRVSPWWLLGAFVLGVLLGMFLWSRWKRNGLRRKVCDGALAPFFNRHTWHDCASAAVLTLLASLVSVTLFVMIVSKEPKVDFLSRWLKLALTNPGGIFAMVTGAGTLIGTYIAIQSILELKHTITSFPQLVDRLVHLMESAQKTPDDKARYLALTPLTGCLCVSRKKIGKLEMALRDSKSRVSMICLNDKEHTVWLTQFNGRRTDLGLVDTAEIETARKKCKGVLETLRAQSDPSIAGNVDPPVQLSHDKMPGYYFFVTSERAIVVAPIFLPLLQGGTAEAGKDLPSVQMLGFETTDRQIVDWLQKEHQRYRDMAAAVQPAEADPPTPPAQTETKIKT